jgi:hypothetical protein
VLGPAASQDPARRQSQGTPAAAKAEATDETAKDESAQDEAESPVWRDHLRACVVNVDVAFVRDKDGNP